jgi:hypothetical protein
MTEGTEARHRILNEDGEEVEAMLMTEDDPTQERHHVKTFYGTLIDNWGSKYTPDGEGGYDVEGVVFYDEKFHFHEEILMGFVAAADGSKYYPDSTGGFIIKSPDHKERRIGSFKNLVAVDGAIYSDDEFGGLMVKGLDGQMHLANSLFRGYLTAEDGSKYYPDYFGEFDVELPCPEQFNILQ